MQLFGKKKLLKYNQIGSQNYDLSWISESSFGRHESGWEIDSVPIARSPA